MIKILDKDLAFAFKIADGIAIGCVHAPNCFFSKEQIKTCPAGLRSYIYFPNLASEYFKIEEFQYIHPCALLEIRETLKQDAPLLFGQFKKICEEVGAEYVQGIKQVKTEAEKHRFLRKAEAEKRHFFAKFLLGFLAIYSANGYFVPNVTKEIFQKLSEEEGIDKKAFCRQIEQELKVLSPKLYKILLERLKNCEYTPRRRKLLFSLFKALLDGILDGIKRNHKEIFDEVERILREARENHKPSALNH